MSLLKNAVLVGITAILVTYLPGYFRTDPPIVTGGYVAPGFEDVLQVFRENFETGRDPPHGGSAFSAYYRGKKVVDIWGGYADVESKQVWKEDTMTVVFSTTKGVAALCIAMLADRGLLDYDKPVAHYWPEFAQKGKGKITVRQLMEHKAGLVLAAPPGLSFEFGKDVAKGGELMASSEPIWEVDGITQGYHALTFGPLTNELLRRVDPKHRTMGQFFDEEVAKPFGVDFHIGLPLQESYRAARTIVYYPSMYEMVLGVIRNPVIRGHTLHSIRNNLIQRALENGGNMGDFPTYNDPANREAEMPSVGGIGTARALAKIYSILSLGGIDPVTNKTLLSKKMVDAFIKDNPGTFDQVIGVPLPFNLGMVLYDFLDGDVKVFGHMGAGGQYAVADPKRQIGMAFISRFMVMGDDPRFPTLLEALYKCVDKL